MKTEHRTINDKINAHASANSSDPFAAARAAAHARNGVGYLRDDGRNRYVPHVKRAEDFQYGADAIRVMRTIQHGNETVEFEAVEHINRREA